MDVRIPADENFDFYACRKLYKKYQKAVGDDVSFNQIIKNTCFYSFYDNKNLVGCIYVFEKNKKIFINGFAKRGFHNFNIKAVKKIFDWFKSDIYAFSINYRARYVLFTSCFSKITDNLFVYYNNGESRKGN